MSEELSPSNAGLFDRSSLHPLLHDVSALIFDAGGTLVHPDWRRLAYLAKAETGRDFSPQQMRYAMYEVLREVDLGLQSKLEDLKQTRRLNWLFVGMFGLLGLNESDCSRLSTRINLEHQKRHLWCEPDSEVLRVLFTLKRMGLRIGVISNTEDGRLEESLKLADIASEFEFLIDSYLVGLRKPDVAIFQLALHKLGIEPHQAVYLGDSYGHDVLGAQGAGLRAILLDQLGVHNEIECARIRSLTDLIEFPQLE